MRDAILYSNVKGGESNNENSYTNKKVLLRERKRHTARCVASARYGGVGGGTPSTYSGGRAGYPIQSWWGVPHPVMVGGTPSSHGEGGTPSSHSGGGSTLGTPTIQTWPGVPPTIQTWPGGFTLGTPTIQTWLRGTLGTPHHPDLAGGFTPGTPPTTQMAGGYPPPSRPGWGTPHHPDLTGVPPPPSRLDWSTPPPVEVWTDKQTENSTFPHPSDAGGKMFMRTF